MRDLKDVEQAFGDVAAEAAPLQRLLRPLLLRATQDPGLMRSLATHSLAQHLPVVGELLLRGEHPGEREPAALPSLTEFLTLARGMDDAEEAYEFAKRLPAALRDRVVVRLCAALESGALGQDAGLSLLAVARLLSLAFDDLPYLSHVLSGCDVAAFPADAEASGAPSPQAELPRAKPSTRPRPRREPRGMIEAVLEPEPPPRRGRKPGDPEQG